MRWFGTTRKVHAVELEQQIASLAGLGLPLSDGVTVDDLLEMFEREQFEDPPFELTLHAYGFETEGDAGWETFCPRAWDFDTECIVETGDYVKIVERLSKISGQEGRLTDISDFVDIDAESAWLKYTADGVQRSLDVKVNDDWVDTGAIGRIMQDLERDGKRFYSKDNGQSATLFYLDSDAAKRLNRLCNNAVKPVLG